MMRMNSSKGFALPAAIFVVVVLGSAVVAMSNLNTSQSSSSLLGFQGSRAYWAARAGIEWGTHQASNGTCNTASTTVSTGISSFSVNVTCSSQGYKEGSNANNVTIYEITSVATYGADTSGPDYVHRKVQATLAVKI